MMSVAVLALFCFAAVPSAKASDTIVTYSVTLTGGTGDCASGTGTLTIDSTADTIELTSSSGCFFGGVGYDSGPTGAGACGTDCTDLATRAAGTVIFNGAGIGACSTPTKCASGASYTFQLEIPSGGIGGADAIVSGSNGGPNSPIVVDFDKAVLVTPEPSTLLLFGSGMLVLAGVFRKRLGLRRTAI